MLCNPDMKRMHRHEKVVILPCEIHIACKYLFDNRLEAVIFCLRKAHLNRLTCFAILGIRHHIIVRACLIDNHMTIIFILTYLPNAVFHQKILILLYAVFIDNSTGNKASVIIIVAPADFTILKHIYGYRIAILPKLYLRILHITLQCDYRKGRIYKLQPLRPLDIMI